jgi:hypothetical protein
VSAFKTAKETLARSCRTIGSLILIKLDKNAVYDEKVDRPLRHLFAVNLR